MGRPFPNRESDAPCPSSFHHAGLARAVRARGIISSNSWRCGARFWPAGWAQTEASHSMLRAGHRDDIDAAAGAPRPLGWSSTRCASRLSPHHYCAAETSSTSPGAPSADRGYLSGWQNFFARCVGNGSDWCRRSGLEASFEYVIDAYIKSRPGGVKRSGENWTIW